MDLTLTENNSQAIYMQLKERLVDYIVQNSLVANSRLPDLKTIAKSAGVSIRTADMSLLELIKEGICYRRPKKGTFVAEKKVDVKKRKICGIFYENNMPGKDTNTITTAVYKGLTEEAVKKDIDLIIISPDSENCIDFYLSNTDFSLLGIINFKCENIKKTIALSKKYPRIKFVNVNYESKKFSETPVNLHGVFSDGFSGAYQIADTVISREKTNFGIISIELEDSNYFRRVKGFQTAIKNNGLEDAAFLELKNISGGDQQKEEVKEFVGKMLHENPGIDAIFCVNDQLAYGTSRYLQEHNIKNICVTGFDNMLEELSREENFSTLTIDFEEMGRKALSVFESKNVELSKIIRVSPELILRGL